jgi:hypothetical protein
VPKVKESFHSTILKKPKSEPQAVVNVREGFDNAQGISVNAFYKQTEYHNFRHFSAL